MFHVIYKEHRVCVQALVHIVHKLTVVIALVAFAGYGIALWVWLQGDWQVGLIIATIAYLLFRNFKRLSIGLAMNRLRGNSELSCGEAIAALEDLMEQHKPQEVMANLEAMIEAEKREINPEP